MLLTPFTYQVQKKCQYVIACVKGNAQTLKHELCHARYYTNTLYKAQVCTEDTFWEEAFSEGSLGNRILYRNCTATLIWWYQSDWCSADWFWGEQWYSIVDYQMRTILYNWIRIGKRLCQTVFPKLDFFLKQLFSLDMNSQLYVRFQWSKLSINLVIASTQNIALVSLRDTELGERALLALIVMCGGCLLQKYKTQS